MKKVAVVILHYKGKKLTFGCLKSIGKVKKDGFEVMTLVIDNHSPEPIDKIPKNFKETFLIKNKANLGFAEGNNVGIKQALKKKADFVFMLNNDTVLDREVLVQLVKVLSLNEKTGLAAPKIYFAPGYEYHRARYKSSERGRVIWYAGGSIDWQNVLASHRGMDEVDRGQHDKIEETQFISGCAMMVKREVFEKIGFLDKRYFLYLEDAEFCLRAKKAGFALFYAPKAKLWHANASSSKVGGSLHDYYLARNRILFGLKYASWRTKLALFRESLRLLFTGRPWQRIGIRDYYLGKFGQGSYR